jgi:hypothetical protein
MATLHVSWRSEPLSWHPDICVNAATVSGTMGQSPTMPAKDSAMDRAKEAIALTLAEVKSFLAQETPPRLSEADTKAYFIEPLIRALGWEGIGVVTREYYVRNSQEFIDYLLKSDTGPQIAIEAKTIQSELVDKHAAQLVQYCAVEGIEWAVLTNGRELHLFNTFLKRDLAAKRVMRLDLLAFNTDDEFDTIIAQLWQLSRAEMTTPSAVRSWMHQRRMDAKLREVLVNPGSSVIQHLEGVLSDVEIQATSQDLTQWFTAILATGPALVMISPTDKQVGAELSINSRTDATTSATGSGRLVHLVRAGILAADTRLFLRKGTAQIAEGYVDAGGWIVYQGKRYKSPSDKTFVELMGRKAMNGWTHWFAEINNQLIVIDELRKQLASDNDAMTTA